MTTLTDVEKMLLRAAIDADETGSGDYNDTRNLFATVEMILTARMDGSTSTAPPPPPPLRPPLPSPVVPDSLGATWIPGSRRKKLSLS